MSLSLSLTPTLTPILTRTLALALTLTLTLTLTPTRYKHMPQQEAAVFSFVLDLSVAMKRTAAGFVEQHEGEARTHYSWLPTRAYREAFGRLRYP